MHGLRDYVIAPWSCSGVYKDFNFVITKISVTTEITEFREFR
jgi:hypothetical protein